MAKKTEESIPNVPGELHESPKQQPLHIRPLNTCTIRIPIIGLEPFVSHAFGRKAQEKLAADQQKTSAEKREAKKNRKPKDFEECYQDSMHVAGGKNGGWKGIPCGAFRNGMVRACKTAGVVMTDAKMALMLRADGYDRADQTPLVRITEGEPHMDLRYARNDDGSTDMRARARWEPAWKAVITIEYDSDLIKVESVVNLLERMGRQVGVGEGRNFSPHSCGMGWGSFMVDRKAVIEESR